MKTMKGYLGLLPAVVVGVPCGVADWKRLERLCRYAARPPIARGCRSPSRLL